ncbi:hypothetical protein GS448_24665 [Rhodococcus hoagii]|nr:hypothetical protein [Prescottella equi]
MTYTPPPPANYYQQPQQWPPPQPPKKKGHWIPSTFAAIGVIAVALFLLNLAGVNLDDGSGPSQPAAPSLIKADFSDTDKAAYESITDRDYAAIAKNPDGNRGRKIIVFGKVFQADSRTGETALLADMGGEQRVLGYDQNTMIRGTADSLRPVVNGDEIQVWATVLGEYEYESMNKTEWRVPLLQANMIEVLPN